MNYPLVVTVGAFSFMILLVRQFVARRRLYHLVWAVSIAPLVNTCLRSSFPVFPFWR